MIDDEYLAIKVLKNHAAQIHTLDVMASFTHSYEALRWMQEHTIDLIFSDIQMPGLTGLELIRKLPYKPAVVFTTAHHDFAVQAYQLDVIDYLLKPVSFERFRQASEKAENFVAYKNMNAGNRQQTGYLQVKADYKIVQIPHHEILLIEGLSEYVKIHTKEKKYIVLTALKSLIEELPASSFVRIHKSFIISKQFIASCNSTSVQTTEDTELPVGRTYKESFLEFIRQS